MKKCKICNRKKRDGLFSMCKDGMCNACFWRMAMHFAYFWVIYRAMEWVMEPETAKKLQEITEKLEKETNGEPAPVLPVSFLYPAPSQEEKNGNVR